MDAVEVKVDVQARRVEGHSRGAARSEFVRHIDDLRAPAGADHPAVGDGEPTQHRRHASVAHPGYPTRTVHRHADALGLKQHPLCRDLIPVRLRQLS
jgi:hypothetical protein